MEHKEPDSPSESVQESAEMSYDGGDEAPQARDDMAESVRARHESRLLAIDGVVGVGLGRNRIGEPSIVVYLRDSSARRSIPSTLDGLTVECRVTGEIDAR